MASSGKEDEEFARRHQEFPYADYLSDSDDDTATALRRSQLDIDEAYAQQLQAEEYSGTSPSAPSHPYLSSKQHSIREDGPPAMSDAEFAAQLYAEDQHQQRRAARRQRPPGTQPFPLRTPNASRPRPPNHQPSSTEEPNPMANFLVGLLQSIAFPDASARGNRLLRGRAVNNLQNTQGDFGPDDYEQLLQLDEAPQRVNLTEEQISTLPTEKFRPMANQTDDEKKCAICMEQFEADEPLRRLTCFHVYHVNCIDRWLKKSNLCPICRVASIK